MAKGKKTGGRQKGTPNKENPLKGYIKAHSLSYFKPRARVNKLGRPIEIEGEPLVDDDGNPIIASDFEMDLLALDPVNRVNAELRLMEYHTPKTKAIDVDMTVADTTANILDRLRQLSGDIE